jgi:hypothetical protein
MKKIKKYYINSGIMLLNMVVFFLFINGIALLCLNGCDRYKTKGYVEKYADVSLAEVYPGMERSKIDAIRQEIEDVKIVYDTYSQFKAEATTGEYVNIHDAGYRIGENQGPWPPRKEDFVIFMFGGSTTFGWGLPDNQTIASYLQPLLSAKLEKKVSVYNFGCPFYFSTQERLLFEKLISWGVVS